VSENVPLHAVREGNITKPMRTGEIRMEERRGKEG
jgi:hypothetical protein